MKLEKYMKTDGAFQRPAWREVPDTEIPVRRGTRDSNVEQIVVTMLLDSGETHSFEGDEVSQQRFHRSAWVMEKMNVTSIPWKTYDNQIVMLTLSDIIKIVATAGQMQVDIWFNQV